MATRIKHVAAVALALLLAGCNSCPQQIQPLLSGMQQLKDLFEAEQANTQNLVASANPPAQVLELFTRTQKGTHSAYMDVYTAMARQVASIGQYSAEETLQLLEKLTNTIVLLKEWEK